MALPKIDVCIVCEGARAELYNKTILLGFYGVAPYVRILLHDFQAPVMLCFVFCGAGGSAGKYNVGLRLTDPTGRVLSNSQTAPDVSGELSADRDLTNIFLRFQGLVGGPGKYRLDLIVNGLEHFSTTFELSQGGV